MLISEDLVLGVIISASCALMFRAGMWKLRHRPLFRGALRAQGLHRPLVLTVLSRLIPIGELGFSIAYAVSMVTTDDYPNRVIALAAVGSIFGVAILAYASRGALRLHGAPCGCLSQEERFGPWTVVRATVVASAGPALILRATGEPPFSDRPTLNIAKYGIELALGVLLASWLARSSATVQVN